MNIDFTNKKTIALLSAVGILAVATIAAGYFVDAAWQSDTGRRFLRKDRGRNQKVGD